MWQPAFFETGTAGFIVTQVGVTAVAMTVIGEGIGQAMGQLVGQRQRLIMGQVIWLKAFGENLALSFIFAGLGRIMKNAAAVAALYPQPVFHSSDTTWADITLSIKNSLKAGDFPIYL